MLLLDFLYTLTREITIGVQSLLKAGMPSDILVPIYLAEAAFLEKRNRNALSLYSHIVLNLDKKNVPALIARSRIFNKMYHLTKDDRLKVLSEKILQEALTYRKEEQKKEAEKAAEKKTIVNKFTDHIKRIGDEIKKRQTDPEYLPDPTPFPSHHLDITAQYHFEDYYQQQQGRKQSIYFKLKTDKEITEIAELCYKSTELFDKLEHNYFKAYDKKLDNFLLNNKSVIDYSTFNALIRFFNDVIARCEYNLLAYMTRAMIYLLHLDFDLAINDFNKIIYFNLNVAKDNDCEILMLAYLNRAFAYFAKDANARNANAATEYSTLSRVDVIRGMTHKNLCQSINFEDDLFKRFVQLEKSQSENRMLQLLSTIPHEKSKKIREETRKILLNPKNTAALIRRAELFLQNQLFFAALEDFSVAIWLLQKKIATEKRIDANLKPDKKILEEARKSYEYRRDIFLKLGRLRESYRDHQFFITIAKDTLASPSEKELNKFFAYSILCEAKKKELVLDELVIYLKLATNVSSDYKKTCEDILKNAVTRAAHNLTRRNTAVAERLTKMASQVATLFAQKNKEHDAMREEDKNAAAWREEKKAAQIKVRKEETDALKKKKQEEQKIKLAKEQEEKRKAKEEKRKRKEERQRKKEKADALEKKNQEEQKIKLDKEQEEKRKEKKEQVKEAKPQPPARIIDLPERLKTFADRVIYLEEKSHQQIYLVGGAVCLALLNDMKDTYIDKDCVTDISYNDLNHLFKQMPSDFKNDLPPNTQLTHAHWLDEVNNINDRTVRYSKLDYFNTKTNYTQSLGETFRHNPRIAKSNGLRRDAKNRDATISSLFGRIKKIDGQYKMEIYDPTGQGLPDLFAKPPRIRLNSRLEGFADASPIEFLTKDPVRILRLFRQAAKYDAKLEEEDKKLIHSINDKKRYFACREGDPLFFRLNDQIRKIAKGKNADTARNEMKKLGVWKALPEDIQKSFGVMRAKYAGSPAVFVPPIATVIESLRPEPLARKASF